jgi:hypothetical protein
MQRLALARQGLEERPAAAWRHEGIVACHLQQYRPGELSGIARRLVHGVEHEVEHARAILP